MQISKRELIVGGSAVLVGAALQAETTANAQRVKKPPLKSDIGQLDRVLVHSIRETDGLTSRISRDLIPNVDYDPVAAAAQQASLMRLLTESGAELVEVHDALETARDATLRNGIWEAWLDAVFPRLGADPNKVSIDQILGRDQDWLYRLDQNGDYAHWVDQTGSTMWTRDSAFMTPAGLVMGNSSSPRRGRENTLLRFAYRYSPLLENIPIAVDAVEKGFVVEGGDAIVVDEQTLFLGVGNRTTPIAAQILARELNMDVYAVQIGDDAFLREIAAGEPQDYNALRVLFLHLDTSFTLVGPKHALALPYVFEKDHAEDNPLSRYLRGAVRQSLVSESAAEKGLEMLKGLGSLTKFAAGSGQEEEMEGTKLIDFCRAEGYKITYTGGALPESDEAAFAHFMRVTYPEQRRQASNVVQATPGRVIAYGGNPATIAALEADGIAVDTFEGRELWNWHGGPHCLTQPLARS